MPKPVIFMFSGQGSHYYHMGKSLYENHAGFRKYVTAFDAVAADIFGRSIAAALYDPSKRMSDFFDDIMVTSPAIIMVEYAAARILMDNGIVPDLIIGASLGEITGMLVAGVMPLESLLKKVRDQLALFASVCEKGRMIAILATRDVYEKSPLLIENSEVAAFNFDSHLVITCRETLVASLQDDLRSRNIAFQVLAVPQGFHSSLLDPAEKIYKTAAVDTVYQDPGIPLISCATTEPVKTIDAAHAWRIFRYPIQFQQTIQKLEKTGHFCYIDAGPSGTLATFTKYNLTPDSGSDVFPIMTPFGRDLKNLAGVGYALCNRSEKNSVHG